MTDGAVVGAFGFGGKKAGGQLVHPLMIGDAFAAIALPGTRFIRAVTLLKIIFLVLATGHFSSPLKNTHFNRESMTVISTQVVQLY